MLKVPHSGSQSDSEVFAKAAPRIHEPRRLYSRDEGWRDSSDSVPPPECPSLRGRLLEPSPIKRNGRDLSVRKRPKLRRRPDKGACVARRNSCHRPCLLPTSYRSHYT